jgi:hypothetical protein
VHARPGQRARFGPDQQRLGFLGLPGCGAGEFTKHSMEGTIGSGGPLLDLSTINSSIRFIAVRVGPIIKTNEY